MNLNDMVFYNNMIHYFNIIAFGMNRLAAVVILSIEAPSFVAFLSFARGLGRFIEGKPYWFKAAIYAT